MSPFESVEALTFSKTSWNKLSESNKKATNVFMINKILSMDMNLIEIVNAIQPSYNIPVKNVYQIYYNILPEKKIFSRYIKKTADKYNKDLLKVLSDHFEVSTKEAKDYVDRLSKERIEHLLYSKGYDDKQIKKLLK